MVMDIYCEISNIKKSILLALLKNFIIFIANHNYLNLNKMKKTLILTSLIFFLLSSLSFAQDKKVAVVTFYVNKKINVGEFGVTAAIAVDKLSDDPNFKMEPLLTKFHTQFFESYSKSFPFQLLPEDQVVNNDS